MIGRELVTQCAYYGAILGQHSRQPNGWGHDCRSQQDRSGAGRGATGQRQPRRAAGADDANYKQSMADLSRRLGERAARQPAVDPGEAKAARRAALEEYDRARGRRLIVGLGLAAAVVVGAGIAYLVPTMGSRPVPPSASAAAQSEPAPPVEVA